MKNVLRFALLSVAAIACKKGVSTSIAPVSPPVKAAIPAQLLANGPARDGPTTPLAAFQSRFFPGEGPTDVLTLLGDIDRDITTVNDKLSGGPVCDTLPPISYSFSPLTDSETFVAQCEMSDTSVSGGFLEFGRETSGAVDLFGVENEEREAIQETPATAGGSITDSDTSFTVEAWLSVGEDNATSCTQSGGAAAWDRCSYGVIHLKAQPGQQAYEMAVAGAGIGFCGAQLKSDGTQISFVGSEDMGTSCNAVVTACVLASDLTTPGDCSGITFDLPPVGRLAAAASSSSQSNPPEIASWGASLYPATPNLTIDGTSGDAVHFGPSTPASGTGSL